MSIRFTGIERVRHEEDHIREARYWESRSMAERVIAGWALADNNLLRGGGNEPQKRTGVTLRRVVRSKG